MEKTKISEIISLSKTSPVLAVGFNANVFGDSTIIEANIPSKSLGIVNTAKGLKTPKWFFDVVKGKSSHQIIINNIDSIDKEMQEKFYEILKYKTISSVDLPKDCNIIVLAKGLGGVSENIQRLCLIVN